MKLFPPVYVLLLKRTGKHTAIQDSSTNCEKLSFCCLQFCKARNVLRIMVGIK